MSPSTLYKGLTYSSSITKGLSGPHLPCNLFISVFFSCTSEAFTMYPFDINSSSNTIITLSQVYHRLPQQQRHFGDRMWYETTPLVDPGRAYPKNQPDSYRLWFYTTRELSQTFIIISRSLSYVRCYYRSFQRRTYDDMRWKPTIFTYLHFARLSP